MKKLVYFFLALSILTSFITRTLGESGILARIAFPDVIGMLAILFFFLSGERFLIHKSIISAFIIVAAFAVGLIVTQVLSATAVEVFILLFLVVSCVIIYSLYRSEEGLIKLLKLIIYTALVTSAMGFYGFAASITGLPNIFAERASGEVISGFRNAGQAGSYALIMITILMPLKSSALNKVFDKRHQILLNIAIVSLILFLFLTGKIAGYIGFAFCLLFSALQKRKFVNVFVIAIIGGGLAIVWYNLENIAPDVYKRIYSKYQTRITANISGENDITENGFIASNLGGAMKVFENHPFTGSGIGGYYTVYDNYEVHSTYFKLLGETGAIGTFAYIYFVIVLFSNFKGVSKIRKKNPYADYLWNLLPFLCACFISWSYTYHLRKREFWILFAVICIVSYLKKSFLLKSISGINIKNIKKVE